MPHKTTHQMGGLSVTTYSDDEPETTWANVRGAALFGVPVAIISAITAIPLVAFHAYVACTLWRWFVAPSVGLALPMGVFVGIRLVWKQVIRQELPPKKSNARWVYELVALDFVAPLSALILGWMLAHLLGVFA